MFRGLPGGPKVCVRQGKAIMKQSFSIFIWFFYVIGGHAEVHFQDVQVPKENILLGPGRGFEIAQVNLVNSSGYIN